MPVGHMLEKGMDIKRPEGLTVATSQAVFGFGPHAPGLGCKDQGLALSTMEVEREHRFSLTCSTQHGCNSGDSYWLPQSNPSKMSSPALWVTTVLKRA